MSTGKLLSCVALAAFLSMALAGAAPFAYITNSGDGTASVIDIASNTVIATVSGLPGAYGVAANASGTRVYVTNNGYGRVSVIDTSSNTVIATIVVNSSGPGPVGVAVNASGTRVYVANQSTGSVSVIDTSSNAVIATVSVGINPVGVAVNADGTRVYVATLHGVNGSETVFSVIDTTSNSVVATTIYALNVGLGPGPTPFGIAVNPAGTRVYADAYSSPSAFVAVLDAVSNLLVAENPNLAGFPAGGIAVNPAGTRYYVTSGGAAGEVNVLNTSNLIVATVPVGVNPVGVSVTPDGARLYVANSGSGNVSVIDTSSNVVVGTIKVGAGPQAFGQFIGPGPSPALTPAPSSFLLAGIGMALLGAYWLYRNRALLPIL